MPYLRVNQNELLHSGVTGQRKGHRRYQNPDGTLTEEGKIHYGRMYGWGNYASDAATTTSTVTNAAKGPTKLAADAIRDKRTKQYKNAAKEKAKTMSDAELKAVVARINLEKNYVKAMTPETVESGADKALKAIEVVGTVAASAAAVAGLAVAIAKVRGYDPNEKK